MNPVHKVVITGTGRAGTTFLVQLLTELGLDTGFTPEEARQGVDARSQAGLEYQLRPIDRKPTLRDWVRQPKHTVLNLVREPPVGPYIIKNPALCDSLGPALADNRLMIDHAYIPMRELEAATLSRMRVGGGNGSVPGGLWKTSDPAEQKAVLAEMFFNLVHTLTVYDVPHTFLSFPRLVEDWSYTYEKLSFLVRGINPERFRLAFGRLARRDLVHNYKWGDGNLPSKTGTAERAPSPRRESRIASLSFLPLVGSLWAGARLATWRSLSLFRVASWVVVLGMLGLNQSAMHLVPKAEPGQTVSHLAPAVATRVSPNPGMRPWGYGLPPEAITPYPRRYWHYHRLHHRWADHAPFEPWRTWHREGEQVVQL